MITMNAKSQQINPALMVDEESFRFARRPLTASDATANRCARLAGSSKRAIDRNSGKCRFYRDCWAALPDADIATPLQPPW